MKDNIKKAKVLAVIPARGGSKGIPRKNIIKIGGIPLLARTVQAVKNCPSIDDVIVSTDDTEIAGIAADYGADVIRRPSVLSDDKASSESAVLHACNQWQKQTGQKYELLMLVQNTSPFHNPEDMRKVIDLMSCENYNSCITITQTHRYFWAKSGKGWYMPYQQRANRQKRNPWFEEAGSLYCVRYELFCHDGNLFPEPVGAVTIPGWRAFEIDEPEDIIFAEALCSGYKKLEK